MLIVDAGISSYYGGRGAILLSANDQFMAVQQTKLVDVPRGHLPTEYLQRLVGRQPNVPAALRQLMNAISESN